MSVEKTEGATLLICWVFRSSVFLRISVRCFMLWEGQLCASD